MGDSKAKEFVKFQNKRKVLNLCKNFLFMLEDIQAESGVISDESFQRLRKRVLDHGNDTIREMEENLDSVKINF